MNIISKRQSLLSKTTRQSDVLRQLTPHVTAALLMVVFVLQATFADTKPLTVALPRVFDTRDGTLPLKMRACFGVYMRERLSQCRSVQLVSSKRLFSIFGELKSAKRDSSSSDLLKDFSAFLSVDVLMDATFTEEEFVLRLLRKTGSKEIRCSVKEETDIQAAVQRAASFVGRELGLTKPENELLKKQYIDSPIAFATYYVCHVHTVRWPNNSGEARLIMMRPLWDKNRSHPLLSARVLLDAEYLFQSSSRAMDYAKTGAEVARFSLKAVLGTEWESAGYPIVRRKPELFEADLLELAKSVTVSESQALEDSFEEAEEDEALPGSDVGLNIGKDSGVQAEQKATRNQRLGALRMLGVANSAGGYKLLETASHSKESDARGAAAFGLTELGEDKGNALLARLIQDKELGIALRAAAGLAGSDQHRTRVLEVARTALASREEAPMSEAVTTTALGILCDNGTPDDAALVAPFLTRSDADIRFQILKFLLKHGKISAEEISRLLGDADDRVVIAVSGHIPEKPTPATIDLLKRLSNDPMKEIAEAARLALAPHRPETERERQLFDLAIEHTYIRMKILDELATSNTPTAIGDLEQACSNQNPYVRAHALKLLRKRDPKRALPKTVEAIRDPYRWVRLQAAAVIVATAIKELSEPLRRAIATEKDAAIKLYLEHALATAEGTPPPQARPAAHDVRGKNNLSWLCGYGEDALNSPFDAYYVFNTRISDKGKAAHRKGKIIFPRVSTVGHPGLIMVDPVSRDTFWQSIDSELKGDMLPFIDGLVFGEETMNMTPSTLWPAGWRLFCIDAGIEPERVKGKKENLSTPEARAWNNWALQRAIDGFNEIYDYVHLKYGKLRPGIQVSTFLPEQGLLGAGPNPGDVRWKFDVGGLYHYKGCTRIAAYDMVRRYKTLWPDRPIIWLSLGIGGYEMNPVRRNQKVPAGPLTSRGHRAYADTITAWLAGADTGFFSVWIFVKKDFKASAGIMSGVQLVAEDLFRNSPVLTRAVNYIFVGAEKDYQLQKDTAKLDELVPTTDIDTDKLGEEEVELVTEEEIAEKAKIPAQIAKEKEQFRKGYMFYGKYIYDCVRLFSGMPRQNPKPTALAIRNGVSVWSHPRSATPLIPAQALLNEYDYLCDINKTASLNLSRYRLIVAHDPSLLTDATISALTDWLKNYPGLLVVHRNLTVDNSDEASTIADLDGTLQNDWPWEGQVVVTEIAEPASRPKLEALKLTGQVESSAEGRVASRIVATGNNTTILNSANGAPNLVLWRDPVNFKGAVLFDTVEYGSTEYLKAVRQTINQVHSKYSIGVTLDRPALHNSFKSAEVVAAACTGYFRGVSDKHAYQGIDLLTGQRNPVVGGGRSGAVLAQNFTGKFTASHSGIAVMSEQPLKDVKPSAGKLTIYSTGLMRASSLQGELNVVTADGKRLPVVEEPSSWLIDSDEEGVARVPFGNEGYDLTFIRSKSPVVLSIK